MSSYLQEFTDELHDTIREMQLEYAKWTNMDYDHLENVLPITVDLIHSYLICTVCLREDDWDYHLHQKMMELFNVVLIDYKIKYSAANYDIYGDAVQYIYATKGYAQPLDFVKRYDEFTLMQNGDSWKGYDEDIRSLTHKILKDLRELDNLGVDYDSMLDDSDLRSFFGQVDCYLEHFKGKYGD